MQSNTPRFEIGTCYGCNQGRACIARSQAGTDFVVCEECYCEWATPTDFQGMHASPSGTFGRFAFLRREAMFGHPWRPFVLNTGDLGP